MVKGALEGVLAYSRVPQFGIPEIRSHTKPLIRSMTTLLILFPEEEWAEVSQFE